MRFFEHSALCTRLQVAATVLCCALAVAAPAASAQEPLRVYSSLPHVGATQARSDDMVIGMRMALADHGGRAAGHPVTLISRNDGSHSTGRWVAPRVAQNARSAAADGTAIAYLGDLDSAASSISSPITNEGGLLQVSPSSSAVGLTRDDRWLSEPGEPEKYRPAGLRTFGRVAPTELKTAIALGSYADLLELERVAVVHEDGAHWRGFARALEGLLNGPDDKIRIGGEIRALAVARARLSGSHLGRVVRTLRGVRAQGMIYVGGRATAAAKLWNRVARVHPRWKLIGSDTIATAKFGSRLRPGAAARTYLTWAPLEEFDTSSGSPWLDRFRAEQGRPADPWAIFGYEAMAVVLDAIERAPDPTSRTDVIDAFFATRNRHSVLGTYSIDEFGDTTLNTYGGYRVDPDGAIAWDRVLRLPGD